MTELTWEERMAAKAKARKDAELAEGIAESNATWESFVQEAMTGLTVEQALEQQAAAAEANPVGCACSIWGPTCCQAKYQARMRVLEQ